MSDIVEQLAWCAQIWTTVGPNTVALLDDARSEITRLRKAVADERDACCATVFGVCASDNEAQRIVAAIRARTP